MAGHIQVCGFRGWFKQNLVQETGWFDLLVPGGAFTVPIQDVPMFFSNFSALRMGLGYLWDSWQSAAAVQFKRSLFFPIGVVRTASALIRNDAHPCQYFALLPCKAST